MQHLIWIPLTILVFSICGYLGFKSNQENSSIQWSVYCWLICALPLWPVIAKYSTNIIRDHLLFNALIVITMNLVTAYFLRTEGGVNFTITQYIGMLLSIIGILLVQFKL